MTLGDWPGSEGTGGSPDFSGAGTGAAGGAASGLGVGGAGDTPSAGPGGVPSPGGVGAGGFGAGPPAGPVPAVLNKDGSISENQAGILVTDFQGPLGLLPR
jgi:hypothetical protein